MAAKNFKRMDRLKKMERQKKIELLKNIQEGTKPAKEVIEILQGERVELDTFLDALKFTSRPENMKVKKITVTGELKTLLSNI